MDHHNTEQTIHALLDILDQNKLIEEANNQIKIARETALQVGVKTYIKGLTRQKLEEAMSSEQACRQLIIELETMLFSEMGYYERSNYFARVKVHTEDGIFYRVLVDYENIPVPRRQKSDTWIVDSHWDEEL